MKKRKFGIAILAFFAAIAAGCTHTRYTEYDPHTGAKTAEFRTSANFNLANTAQRDDSNAIGGLPLFTGSGVDQATRTTGEPVTAALQGHQPTVAFGDFSIYGTVDHATPIRENWIGIRGVAKSLVTAILGTVGLKEWSAVKQANETTTRTLGSQAVETESLRQATTQATIAADQEVEMTRILAE